jgi:hypothetical protein
VVASLTHLPVIHGWLLISDSRLYVLHSNPRHICFFSSFQSSIFYYILYHNQKSYNGQPSPIRTPVNPSSVSR